MSASPLILALVAVGGAGGAVLRYLVEWSSSRRVPGVFPWGILGANVVASFLAGFTFAVGAQWAVALFAGGFAGSLSTYSTFAYDTVRLSSQGWRGNAVVNVVMSIALGLAAAALGWTLGSALGSG
jgi:fluoride exporter